MKKIISFSLLALVITGGVFTLMATSPSSTNPDPEPATQLVEKEIFTTVSEVTGMSSYKLETESHNFGEVKMGETARHTFWFTNTGDEDIVIENVKPSCSCTASNYSQKPIAPGEKGFVEVVYPAKKVGVFRKTATITANTDPKNKVLSINGEVVN